MRTPAFVALSIFFVCSAALADADIFYETEVVGSDKLSITMRIPVKAQSLTLQMPNWAPGAYVLEDFGSNVSDFSVSSGSFHKEGNNTWRIAGVSGKELRVSYSVPVKMEEGAVDWSGPSSYMYVVGRMREPHYLTLKKPSGWQSVVGLDEVKGKPNRYVALDYDTLADNPVTMGDLEILRYEVKGRPHIIALRGMARRDLDKDAIVQVCKDITELQVDFFRDMPYKKYVWHLKVLDGVDGAGGLEHLSSTQVGMGSGLGPGVVSTLSHEFFHLWNAKRIRSRVLGPFDYTKLPITSALWWLEGVTDYYSQRLLHDYRVWERPGVYNNIAGNWRAVVTNPDHVTVSPEESSRRSSEMNDGKGSYTGYKVPTYNLGWLAGLCFDIEIRHQTGNKRSLDDVMRALYERTRSGRPGFEEGEIRKQIVRFGGPALGPFYDEIILKPGPMPVQRQLDKVGLKLSERDFPFTDLGFSWTAMKEENALRVSQVRAAASPLQVGDLLLQVNGVSFPQKGNRFITVAANELFGQARVGEPVRLVVKRGVETLNLEVVPAQGTRRRWIVEEDPGASGEAKALRETWLAPRKVDLSRVVLRNPKMSGP